MKVLYYAEPLLNSAFSGVQNVAFYLVNSLRKSVQVSYFPAAKPNFAYLRSLLDIQLQLFSKKFDVVHYNIVPNIMVSNFVVKTSSFLHVPSVLTVHGIIQIENVLNKSEDSFSCSLNLSSTLSACKNVDLIIVNSTYMRHLVEQYYGVGKDKIVVIPNGVDLSRFVGFSSNSFLEGTPSVLFMGGISRIKGVDIMIDAISQVHSKLPGIKLHIIGPSFNELQQLQAHIKKAELEDHVIYHGMINYSQVPSYLKSADICVFASRHESFGIALLEAMAARKPILASSIDGFREIASSQDVLFFKSGDKFDLSDNLLRLSEDSELRSKISNNAFCSAKKYDWDVIAEKYVNCYKLLSH